MGTSDSDAIAEEQTPPEIPEVDAALLGPEADIVEHAGGAGGAGDATDILLAGGVSHTSSAPSHVARDVTWPHIFGIFTLACGIEVIVFLLLAATQHMSLGGVALLAGAPATILYVALMLWLLGGMTGFLGRDKAVPVLRLLPAPANTDESTRDAAPPDAVVPATSKTEKPSQSGSI
ncbi:MAG: hypothetical protein OJF49_000524 [Ktedonobacterales bacterium]|jgi:hypothetical protein|nr:MAG: hypothetical protein OJF49_000524 [Ktedonobacterales bacterium]